MVAGHELIIGIPFLGLVDGDGHDGRFEFRARPVLQVGLGPGHFGQGQVAAFLVQIAEAVKAVPRLAHHPARLGHATRLLGQFQQAGLGLDHLAFGHRHGGLSSEPAGALRFAYGYAPRPLSPTNSSNRHIMTRL